MTAGIPAQHHTALREAPKALHKQAAFRRHIQRTGAALLNQQCWLWGCDVRYAAGNLLMRRGFERTRPPAQMDRSTQYTLVEQGFLVRLWGSGMYAGSQTDGVFLNRFTFEPRCAAFEVAAWQDPMLFKRAPRYWHQADLARLCAWVADYEMWILNQCGIGYRRVCLQGFHESVSRAEAVATEWQQLAGALRGADRIGAASASVPVQPAFALKPVTTIAGC